MEFFPTARARRLNRLSKELRVTLPVRLSELRNLAAMVEAFGDENQLPATKVFAINLELDELITNIVSYGNFGALDPKIEILLRIEHGVLTLTMEDNGKPFDPTFDTEPNTTSPLESREVGGLGLHLVKSFADRVSYEFVEGKNRSTLEHDLKPA
jgi:anti-sigma regulatory factor (Ser/Thr protein kinase)